MVIQFNGSAINANGNHFLVKRELSDQPLALGD
jgi:hypothetical protein